MPLSRYDESFGGKRGAATKAHTAMVSRYGAKRGERVFYATMNSRRKKKRGRASKSRLGDALQR